MPTQRNLAAEIPFSCCQTFTEICVLVEKISEKNMDLQLMPEGTKSPVSILKM